MKLQGLQFPGGSVKVKTQAFFLGRLQGQRQGSCFSPHFPGHPSTNVYDTQPWVYMAETGRQLRCVPCPQGQADESTDYNTVCDNATKQEKRHMTRSMGPEREEVQGSLTGKTLRLSSEGGMGISLPKKAGKSVPGSKNTRHQDRDTALE